LYDARGSYDGSLTLADGVNGGEPLILYDIVPAAEPEDEPAELQLRERSGDLPLLGVARPSDPSDPELTHWTKDPQNPVHFTGAGASFPSQVWKNGARWNFVRQMALACLRARANLNRIPFSDRERDSIHDNRCQLAHLDRGQQVGGLPGRWERRAVVRQKAADHRREARAARRTESCRQRAQRLSVRHGQLLRGGRDLLILCGWQRYRLLVLPLPADVPRGTVGFESARLERDSADGRQQPVRMGRYAVCGRAPDECGLDHQHRESDRLFD
jgi:hypothetical protein